MTLTTNLQTLGDPHIGKRFKTGVPLDRLGDREAFVRKEFRNFICNDHCVPELIIMGDLFDSFMVSNSDVLFVAQVLFSAIQNELRKKIFILRGNHDASLDSTLKSSFDVLEWIMQSVPEVIFVTDTFWYEDCLMVGWHPFKTAKQQIEEAKESYRNAPITKAYGHWDILQFGENDKNTIPVVELEALGVTKIYTGHYHKRQTIQNARSTTFVVGSMQPYAHGEQDPSDLLYVTLSYESYKAKLLDNEDYFKFSNVRILLPEGTEFDGDTCDCLSLIFKRVAAENNGEDEAESVEVMAESFNFNGLLQGVLTSFEVSAERTTRIANRFIELKAGE